ncbi:hypothetical protein QTI51_09680 [Variovorax sp. J22G73]|uniref:hypothetical protein n=1 Tax=unclassified Variovorax TaxID=663243 RepID=UPI002576C004|nr:MULTISPECIES: hypothetical protein [unclassified Variovorax]MDM0006430.1 hypothetical protein [Variovorax sp. J22R203]MDM0097547.1 hypothetical protein [Variovorax sp. J22G73]
MKERKPTGYVIYRGPSLLDGSPIVAIALVHSTNAKTGDMVQTYILRADENPLQAMMAGRDAAICGDCKHRPSTGGACYVNVGQGPNAVYKALERGNYPDATPEAVGLMVAGRMVRLGTYGDPAAVPVHVWQWLVAQAAGRTGYTHQWRNEALAGEHVAHLMDLVMASCDSEAEADEARAMGYRYFRVRANGGAVARGEFICPASNEAGKRKTCSTCGACDGSERGALKASPTIIVHGAKARRFIAIAAA